LKNRKGGEKGKNMKNNKFCVSRTLVYMVLLVAAVAGIFYGINYTNSQKLGGKPRAAGTPPECPYYTTIKEGSREIRARFPAGVKDKNGVCYGFTGRYTTNNNVINQLPDTKIVKYNSASYRGCYLEPIPCKVYDKSNPIKDTNTCPVPGYHWAPNPSPTGYKITNGKNSSYVFKDICVRNTGYKIVSYAAANVGNYSSASYECLTTTQGVSEWNCNTKDKVPTPIVTIDNSSGRVTYNNSTGKTLIVKVEDMCPKGKIVWRSYLYDDNGNAKDATTFDWTNNTNDIKTAHKNVSWDLCAQLTGYGQVNKNPTKSESQPGEPKVRCLTTIVSNSLCVNEYPN
jgi:hypothetical protein